MCTKDRVNKCYLDLYIHISIFIGCFLYGGDDEQTSMDTALNNQLK